jgi:hypothetical protein
MTLFEISLCVVAGFLTLVVAVYVCSRVWSIAHFRTRSEYDQGVWHKRWNGDKPHG